MVKQSTTMLSLSLMGALVIIPVAVFFVVGSEEGALAAPATLLLVAIPAAGAAVHVLLESIGYRVQPIAPGTPEDDARGQAVARWQASMIQRFALSESIAIVSLALCFVVEQGGYVLLLLGCATSLTLMAVHVFPWSRPVGKVADALERDGARSGLREVFGQGGGPGGAIREL
ncbi:hypothetical protein [Nocardioides aestuarii]|uniref:MFS transporter n=1 Tax=Nocardioides aestuarii TaxID=252231 RepID=A0ABW4TR58_9ACTN